MSRADRTQLGWKRPPEWDRFEATVEKEYGATSPYCGFVLEQSWREYQDDHPAEEYADRLLQAVGTNDSTTREKNLSRTAYVDDDRQVWVSVKSEVKQEMEQFATEANVPNHSVLRAVVCWYIDGGLLGYLTEKLERAVPEAEDQLANLDPEDDRGLTAEERKPQWLAKYLTPDNDGQGGFTKDDFGEALEEMPFRGRNTDHMREKWLPEVLGRLNYVRHPSNPDLFIPENQARHYADDETDLDGPAIDRFTYEDLSDEQRVDGLRIKAVQKASTRGTGLSSLTVEEVRDGVFNGVPSKRKAKGLIEQAARADGFSTDAKVGKKRLKTDLSEVDRGLLLDAGLDTDGEDADGPAGADVAERMDVLSNAAPADGGRENP